MVGLCEYQIRILKQDMGKMFIPMYFYNMESEGKTETNIRYDVSNHICLEEWLVKSEYGIIEVLDILENVALLLDKCKEVLINYQNLEINCSTLFVSTGDDHELKLQYIPKEKTGDDFLFFLLVNEIEKLTSEKIIKEYLEIVLKKIDQERPNLPRIINLLGQLKREIYICGWIGKNRPV